VTRDRIEALCEHDGVYFDLVDTGGYGIVDRDDLSAEVEQQIQYAVDQAALILFVVDAREGLMPPDQEVAGWLRRCDRPVLLLANKVDSPGMPTELADFHRLGRRAAASFRCTVAAARRSDQMSAAGTSEGRRQISHEIAIVRRAASAGVHQRLAGQEHDRLGDRETTRDAVDVRFALRHPTSRSTQPACRGEPAG
jgi:GTP-binding protein